MRTAALTYIAAPTDKSTPAMRRTNVIPMAITAMYADWVRMFAKFCGLRNRGDRIENRTTTITNMIAGVARSTDNFSVCRLTCISGSLGLRMHCGCEDCLVVEGRPRKLPNDFPVRHGQNSVADPEQLLEF